MPFDPCLPTYSMKRLQLCSRENAVRVASRIFDARRRACVIRTGHPLQPFRAVEAASSPEQVEVVLCA